MPTYEYVCKSCGHLFEIVQSMRDDPLTECPECGGELRKVFAPPAISFKGSGFYATDHGKKKAETGAAKSDAKSGSSSPDSKSDQKSGEKSGQSTGEKKESSGTPGTGANKKDAPAPASSSTSKKEGGGGS